jgi:excinuclease UvrABC helicase subunit UvrB
VKPLLKQSINNRIKSLNFDQLLDQFEDAVKDAGNVYLFSDNHAKWMERVLEEEELKMELSHRFNKLNNDFPYNLQKENEK